MSQNLSPAFSFVRDAKKINLPVWQLLAMIAQADRPMFVRHAMKKPAGCNITAYDSSIHTILRASCQTGQKRLLSSIAEQNENVQLLDATEYVTPDRLRKERAVQIGYSYYPDAADLSPGLTD